MKRGPRRGPTLVCRLLQDEAFITGKLSWPSSILNTCQGVGPRRLPLPVKRPLLLGPSRMFHHYLIYYQLTLLPRCVIAAHLPIALFTIPSGSSNRVSFVKLGTAGYPEMSSIISERTGWRDGICGVSPDKIQ